MQLPRESASAQVRIRYGRYVARRLRTSVAVVASRGASEPMRTCAGGERVHFAHWAFRRLRGGTHRAEDWSSAMLERRTALEFWLMFPPR